MASWTAILSSGPPEVIHLIRITTRPMKLAEQRAATQSPALSQIHANDIRVIVHGDAAWVRLRTTVRSLECKEVKVCPRLTLHEHSEDSEEALDPVQICCREDLGGASCSATNIFVRSSDASWAMCHHSASPVMGLI